RECTLAAGEQRDAARLGARRLGDDLDAGLQRVFAREQLQARHTAAKERLKRIGEIFPHLLKGEGKLLLRGAVDLVNGPQQLGLGVGEIRCLSCKEVVALLEVGIFLDGYGVDRAHGLKALAERVGLSLDGGPVSRVERGEIGLRWLAL